jgi:hypothetical protein
MGGHVLCVKGGVVLHLAVMRRDAGMVQLLLGQPGVVVRGGHCGGGVVCVCGGVIVKRVSRGCGAMCC